jgi:hypothetical protein
VGKASVPGFHLFELMNARCDREGDPRFGKALFKISRRNSGQEQAAASQLLHKRVRKIGAKRG